MRARLARMEKEYRQALDEIEGLPDGNGFATQKEMRKSATHLYGSTIASLQRKLGLY